MEWVSFFIGCGVMCFALCAIFVLMPAHSDTRKAQDKQRDDMSKLYDFWFDANHNARVRNEHLIDIVTVLLRIEGK